MTLGDALASAPSASLRLDFLKLNRRDAETQRNICDAEAETLRRAAPIS